MGEQVAKEVLAGAGLRHHPDLVGRLAEVVEQLGPELTREDDVPQAAAALQLRGFLADGAAQATRVGRQVELVARRRTGRIAHAGMLTRWAAYSTPRREQAGVAMSVAPAKAALWHSGRVSVNRSAGGPRLRQAS